MLTAHGSIETAIQAMKKGAYDYLTKPFHLPELEIHIQKAYEKVQLARRERQWVEHHRLRVCPLPAGRLQAGACSASCSSSRRWPRPTPPS